MPYPNEHAARIRDPDQYNRFRRENNKFGPGIHAIWGMKVGESIEIQAIRFDKENYTVEEAKIWLKNHKISYLKFEPAKNGSETGEKMNSKNVIEHVGVLGMKWGRRSGGRSTGSRPGGAKKTSTTSAEHRTASALKKKKISDMTNDELRAVTNRMQLEQTYRSLNPSNVSKGKKVVFSTINLLQNTMTAVNTISAAVEMGKKFFPAKP